MTTKLWSKGYELDATIEAFEAARNAALDAQLVRHDLWGSLAHARMLRRIGVLADDEWGRLDEALRALLADAEAATLRPSTAQEDVHTAIEQALVARVGASGKRIHTGRSPNDQVLLDLRLFVKEALAATSLAALDAASTLVALALALVMLDLSKWAQDVLLFTTSEYGFFEVPQELCAGSSIMPQKRNLDALELVRARAHTVIALQSQMLATLAGLPSGYNMDYQETKTPLVEAARSCRE